MRRVGAIAAAVALAVSLCACGGGDDEAAGTDAGLPDAGGGGLLVYTVPTLPRVVDPLTAGTASAQVVARQVYEPLVSRARAPYGGRSAQAGLAEALEPSDDRSTWTVVLRPGVAFHDGSPLDAAAVLANARRWATTPEGAALLPGLFAADNPRPGVVRLLFRGPQPQAARLLASPRLGIVSRDALAPASGNRAEVDGTVGGAGTGPFELGAVSSERIEVARNAAWWGTLAGLGPALDSAVFAAEPEAGERIELLRSGGVQVAASPGRAGLAAASGDPLLRSAGGPRGVAYSAAVRGLEAPPPAPQLSGVWLTTIG